MEEKNQSKFFVVRIIDKYVKNITGNWWVIFLMGVIAVLLGFSFIIWPTEALQIIAYFLGIFIVIVGIFYIASSFKVKRIGKGYEKLKDKIKSKFD